MAPAHPSGAVEERDDAETEHRPERAVLCRRCRGEVTSARHADAVDGAHRHTFFNPAGILFEIGCYREAPGCTVHGAPTEEFSWFRGFAWRYAVCGACHQHLGWRFESAAGTAFFGLILNRLVEEEQAP